MKFLILMLVLFAVAFFQIHYLRLTTAILRHEKSRKYLLNNVLYPFDTPTSITCYLTLCSHDTPSEGGIVLYLAPPPVTPKAIFSPVSITFMEHVDEIRACSLQRERKLFFKKPFSRYDKNLQTHSKRLYVG